MTAIPKSVYTLVSRLASGRSINKKLTPFVRRAVDEGFIVQVPVDLNGYQRGRAIESLFYCATQAGLDAADVIDPIEGFFIEESEAAPVNEADQDIASAITIPEPEPDPADQAPVTTPLRVVTDADRAPKKKDPEVSVAIEIFKTHNPGETEESFDALSASKRQTYLGLARKRIKLAERERRAIERATAGPAAAVWSMISVRFLNGTNTTASRLYNALAEVKHAGDDDDRKSVAVTWLREQADRAALAWHYGDEVRRASSSEAAPTLRAFKHARPTTTPVSRRECERLLERANAGSLEEADLFVAWVLGVDMNAARHEQIHDIASAVAKVHGSIAI